MGRLVMWRLLASVVAFLIGFEAVQAQSIPLAEAPLPKACFRIELGMELAGKITVQQEGKNITLKQTATARHEFVERILEAKDTQEGVSRAEKAARIYRAAEATIAIESDVARRALRPEHALMVSQRAGNQLVSYCPQGLLTNEEKELTEHFDTLALPGILSAKEAAVGATWTIPTHVVLALCDIEALVSGSLSGKLS